MSNKKTEKLTRKQKIAQSKQKKETVPLAQYIGVKPKVLYGIILAFSFILYGNTILNKFALDDGIVITKNEFTKKGIAGWPSIFKYDTFAGEHGTDVKLVAGGRYRPLTVAMFALEYMFWGENPHFYHLINILLYALSAMLLYKVLARLFYLRKDENTLEPPFANTWYFSVPFIATLLFIAHPVHTEAVANIKGRDEIMTLMGALFTTWFAIRYHETKKKQHLAYIFVAMFAGLLAKENAVTFLVITPAALYYFAGAKIKESIISIAPMALAVFVFLAIRASVLGQHEGIIPSELMNDPFVNASGSQKVGTILLTLGMYIKLLLVPHPLTWDYYPYHIPLVNPSDYRAVLSILLYTGMAVVALVGLRKRSIFSFAVLLFIASLSPMSNIFFAVGVFLSERFIYISSIAFVLVVAYAVFKLLPTYLLKKGASNSLIRTVLLSFMVVVLGLYSVKVITRNLDWKDNFSLFTHDVKTSYRSAKSNTTAGEQLVIRAGNPRYKTKKEEYLALSKHYLNRAIKIHPYYIAAYLDLGVAHERSGEYYKAIENYMITLRFNRTYEKGYNNIATIFFSQKDMDKQYQFKIYKELFEYAPDRFYINYFLGGLYGSLEQNAEKAIFHLEKAVAVKKDSPLAFTDLATAYTLQNRFIEAAAEMEKAVALNPRSSFIYKTAATIFRKVGKNQRATEMDKKVAQFGR